MIVRVDHDMEEAHEGRLLASMIDPLVRRVVGLLRHLEHSRVEVGVRDLEAEVVEGPAGVEDPRHNHVHVEAQRRLPAALFGEVVVEGRGRAPNAQEGVPECECVGGSEGQARGEGRSWAAVNAYSPPAAAYGPPT